jgi:hypothetical protein
MAAMKRDELRSLGWDDDELVDKYAEVFGVRPGLDGSDDDRVMKLRRRVFDELQLRLSGKVFTDTKGAKVGPFALDAPDLHRPSS